MKEEDEKEGGDSPLTKRNKSPTEIKTEYLSKLFQSNIQGEKIHNRDIKKPNPKIVKKIDRNHFEKRHKTLDGRAGPTQTFDSEADKFDSTGAANLMMSKGTQSKMNSLFMDTKMINQSSLSYNPNLSKPGALEQLDKNYASVFTLESKRAQHDLDYDIIREQQKSTNNDVSLMTDFQSR